MCIPPPLLVCWPAQHSTKCDALSCCSVHGFSSKAGVVCREPIAWVHADATCKRLDEKHLVSQRVQMPLPHLAYVVSEVSIHVIAFCLLSWVRCVMCLLNCALRSVTFYAAAAHVVLVVQKLACKESGRQADQYRQLLDALNDVAHHEINEWMRHEQQLSEPFVARTISQQLPSGVSSTS